MDKTIKILVADDHKIIRKGIRSLLDNEAGMEVVAEAENGRKTIELARKHLPDVVIMDVSMPDMNGVEATRQIVTELPDTKVIALSMHHHEQFISGMFVAGASGYLLKDCSVEELTAGIRAVNSGKAYLSPSVASIIVKNYVRHLTESEKSPPPLLTPREREVLQLVTEGQTSKDIADQLSVSVKTVDTHRQQIMAKLGVNSIAELTKYAIRTGITSLDT